MTTEPLTNTELAEKRVQELAAALDYWRERAEAAEAKLAGMQTAALSDVAYAVGLDWPTATRRDILDAIRASSRRLAELAAALAAARAAQQWRPGNVEPPAHDWYWVYDFADDDVPTRRFYGPQGWGQLGDEDAPDWYMPIPPLPAETTQ